MSYHLICSFAATALLLTSCGGGGSSSDPAGAEQQNDEKLDLATTLTTGSTAQENSVRWDCNSSNSQLSSDGIHTNEFRLYANQTGQEGDYFAGLSQNINWQVSGDNEFTVSFVDIEPPSVSIARQLQFNADYTQFTAVVEETVGVELPHADYTCNRTTKEPSPPDDTALIDRLVNALQPNIPYSWACVTSNSSDTNTYTFNADGTGTDYSSADQTQTTIDFVITGPDTMRATYTDTAYTNYASFVWTQVSFQDDRNFTAIDGLEFDSNVVVSCTRM